MSGMAASALVAVRAIPLPAAEHLQAPAAAAQAVAGAIREHASMASAHMLVHGPYVAILAAEALVLYCLTRLVLSLVQRPSQQSGMHCKCLSRSLINLYDVCGHVTRHKAMLRTRNE